MNSRYKRLMIPQNRNVEFEDRFINEDGHIEWVTHSDKGEVIHHFGNGYIQVIGNDCILERGISYEHRVWDDEFEYWTTLLDDGHLAIWTRNRSNGHIYEPEIRLGNSGDENPYVLPQPEWYAPPKFTIEENIIDRLEREKVYMFDVDFDNRITVADGTQRWVRRNEIGLPELWTGHPEYIGGDICAEIIRPQGAYYDVGQQWCYECHVEMDRIGGGWICPICGQEISLCEVDDLDEYYCPTLESSYRECDIKPEAEWQQEYGYYSLIDDNDE